MVNATDQSWQQSNVVTGHDPLATVEEALGEFDLRLEPLVVAAESLQETAQAAHEASHDLVERCAKLLARILEVVIWSSEGEQRTSFPGAEEIVQFVRAAATTLRSALDEQPGALQLVSDLTSEATRRWGEWIDLLDDNDQSSEAGAWPEGNRQHTASKEDADLPEEVDSDAIPSAEELARVLAAIGCQQQAAELEETPSCQTQPASASIEAPHLLLQQTVDIEPELLEAYLDDAARCLASLETATLRLEQVPHDRSSLKQVCRELHTMKGASASVGLNDLANYLHAVEESLQHACESPNGSSQVEGMLASVDAGRSAQALASVATSIQVEGMLASVDAVRKLFTQLSSRQALARNDSDRVLHRPAEFQDNACDSTDTIRVESSRLDRLMDMLAELVMLRNRRESQVAELQTSNDELLRCATTLRVEADNVASTVTVREKHPLNEIAADFLEIARNQREICQRVTEENLVVSGFIRNFRQELTELQRLPVAGLFRRLQRAVRDAAQREGKQVRLQMLGEHAGLERSLQERLYEPLMHIVRNAVSHGIEPEPLRVAAGKDPVGTIELEALGGSNLLVLEIRDDGKGLDYDAIRRCGVERGLIAPQQPTSREELAQLIFHPGFSTKAESNAVSGRGIGMDVVAETLRRMSSWIEVESAPHHGTRIRLSIPLRSVIQPAMVFRCAGQLLAVPMQVVHCAGDATSAKRNAGSPGAELPSIHVDELWSSHCPSRVTSGKRLVIGYSRQVLADSHFGSVPETERLATRARRFELFVDEIVGPEEVVIRPLPPLLRHQSLFSGITLSGRGEVVLLFDSRRLIEMGLRRAHAMEAPTSLPAADSGAAHIGKRVLVADDSISARRCLARLLRQHDLEVTEVSDGFEALEQLQSKDFVAVFSDLEMPRVGGLELLSEIGKAREEDQIPVVIVSSRSEDEFRTKAMQLGAKDYLLKPAVGSQITKALERIGLVQGAQAEGENR
ncbi:MAG TPA: response regulator [Pirellulaceae bacterium]|nr:response regulator [Pirellulaceae bacterium]